MCARSKGTGSLVKRGKYYQCKVVVNGVPHYKATGTASKVEAKKILEEFVRPFLASTDVERLESIEARIKAKETEAAESESDYSNVRLDFLLDRYYATANAHQVSESTRALYERYLNKMLGWAKDNAPEAKKVKDVDKAFAEGFLEWLKPSVSASYFNCALAMLRKVWKEFGRLSKHRCFKENPWDGYRYKTADLSVKRPLTQDEIARLFKAIDDPDMRTLFKIGLYTGLRLVDCCKLKWKDVDLERRFMKVTPIKTRRYGVSVTIPMHPVLCAELKVRSMALAMPGSESEYVCPALANWYDNGRGHDKIGKIFDKANIGRKADGRVAVSFHSLRHTFVSMSVSAGVPLDVVRQIVGHTSTKMTEHYSHASDEALTKAVNAIPSVGHAARRKVLVEVDSSILKELEALGLGVEEALNELINVRKHTVTVEPAA